MTVAPRARELRRLRAMGRARPKNPPEGSFTQVPRNVRLALAHLPGALVTWMSIEAWVGKSGGSGEVPQRAIIRELGWAPSTYWNHRRLLIMLGMVSVAMPVSGPAWGPGARRRLTLPDVVRRVVAAAGKLRPASRVRAGRPPPTAQPSDGPDRRDAPPSTGPPPEGAPGVADGRSALAHLRRRRTT